MSNNKISIELSMPVEWVLRKVLGPTLDNLGEDISKVYQSGRDRIVRKALEKISDKEDDKLANLRVARDIFWNGSFSNEAICAEYFGGILASSRSEDGRNDSCINYVDVIKSLSSKQLHLHYVVYNAFNKHLVHSNKNLNVGLSDEIHREVLWFSFAEFTEVLDSNIDTDLNILWKQGLLSQYFHENKVLMDKKVFQYIKISPTTFGVLLYAAAHNKIEFWRSFSSEDFGYFTGVQHSKHYGVTLSELIGLMGFRTEDIDNKSV